MNDDYNTHRDGKILIDAEAYWDLIRSKATTRTLDEQTIETIRLAVDKVHNAIGTNDLAGLSIECHQIDDGAGGTMTDVTRIRIIRKTVQDVLI